MGLEVDPDFANNRRIYTCQGGFTGAAATTCTSSPGPWTRSCARRRTDKVLVGGFPTSSGRHGGCRLIVTERRVAAGRHRRRRPGHQPAGPGLAGRQDAAARPVHRRAVAGNPFAGAQRAAPLRAHLRPPQRPGRRRARRRHAVVDRAGHRPRRRGQPARQRRRLRLQPGPRLQRVGPDDRPVPARRPGRGHVAVRQPDARHLRRRVRGRRASGAPSTARSRWPASRPAGCCS